MGIENIELRGEGLPPANPVTTVAETAQPFDAAQQTRIENTPLNNTATDIGVFGALALAIVVGGNIIKRLPSRNS